MKLINAIAFICFCTSIPAHSTDKAVINVPIADLLGQQMSSLHPNNNVHKEYESIAHCAGLINSSYACPRLHQLLYNDIVDLIKTVNDEVCIRITHAYYCIPSSTTPQTQYWTLKKNIMLCNDLTSHNITPDHLPQPIDFSDLNHHALNHADIVTLTEPHHDATLRVSFSAGTRFVKVPQHVSSQKKKPSTLEVFAINYKTMKELRIKIPAHKCTVTNPLTTKKDRIDGYVNLLKKWANIQQGCIPYTWGGTSFSRTTVGNFKEVTHRTNNSDYSSYEYEKDTQTPKSGFDCSGAILRAAQICGIPYFCKNTATIAHCLAPLTTEQNLTAGDIILIRGHVMVVSNVTKNLLIEARSYAHGYGKLHEIPLNQVFDGMQSYQDLTDAYHNKTVIKRKDKQGTIRDTFAHVQLFSMLSAWNNDKK